MSEDQRPPDGQDSKDLPSTETAPFVSKVGQRVGPFRLLQKLGEGGMGEVWEAEQTEPVRRRVALKLIKLGMDTKQVVARFEAERQALAMMNHPNIAKVFDAGSTPEGRPYFVMEYVKGVPITEHCDRQRLTTRERLKLFVQVCAGVQHAHQKAIIHRDIKPSNVLVAIQDGEPVPKIIDFGVAKAVEQRLTEQTLFTELGQIVGTPEYMSPEQAEMTQQDIDTRTDVYSLGVMLYELLVGALPFDLQELRRAGFDEIRRRIREEEPSKPSTRVSTLETAAEVARRRHTDIQSLQRQLRGDLDWIVIRALEKDRTRRYETASELAKDIKHHLANEPIVAGPPGIAYKLRKFVKRNQVAVTAGALMATALVLGLIVAAIGFRQASRERDLALLVKQESLQQAYSANIAAARAALAQDEIAAVRRRLDAAPREFRNWEWRYLNAVSDNSLLVLRGHGDGVTSVAFSPDDTRLASASADKTVRLWNAATGEELIVLRGHEDGVFSLAFSPDGSRLATVSGGRGDTADNTVRLWDVSTGEEVAVLRGHRAPVRSVAFSPDGKQVASASGWMDEPIDDSIRLWDLATGVEMAVLRGHQSGITSVTYGSDGKHLASASFDRTIRLWDTSALEELAILSGHGAEITTVAFSSDGKRLASASYDKTVRVWETETETEPVVLKGHEGFVFSVAFSPDGAHVASASSDRTVRVWDMSTGKDQATLKGHESSVLSVAFSSDGTRLASGSSDGTVRVWDPTHNYGTTILEGLRSWISALAFSADGRLLAAVEGGGEYAGAANAVHIWDASTGEELALLQGHYAGVTSVAFSPDGTRLASGSWDKTVRLWDAGTGIELAVLCDHRAPVWHVVFSPDGTRLASASGEYREAVGSTVRLWDATTGEELQVLGPHEDYVRSVTFSPDGARLYAASGDGTVRVWDAFGGRALGVVRGALWWHQFTAFVVSFSPDAAYVATRENKDVHLCSLRTGEETATLRGHEEPVQSVTFSPDGTRLASGSVSGTIRVWDTATGEEMAVLRGPEEYVYSLAFSPDGTRLAAGLERTVLLWDAVPYRARHRERQAIVAARPEAERVVDDLRQQMEDWGRVAQRVRVETELSEDVRHAALNEVLRRAALAEQEAILAVWPEVQRLLDDAWRELGDWTLVAERVRGNKRLSERVRRVVVNEALHCAIGAERLEAKKRVADAPDARPSALNDYAWLLLTCEPARLRDPAAALPVAIKANELTHQQNPACLDTLALAYHLTGDAEKATETQKEAISLLPKEAERSGYEERLVKYRAVLRAKRSSTVPIE